MRDDVEGVMKQFDEHVKAPMVHFGHKNAGVHTAPEFFELWSSFLTSFAVRVELGRCATSCTGG